MLSTIGKTLLGPEAPPPTCDRQGVIACAYPPKSATSPPEQRALQTAANTRQEVGPRLLHLAGVRVESCKDLGGSHRAHSRLADHHPSGATSEVHRVLKRHTDTKGSG